MLHILLFLMDWILLSSFWLFPSALAKGMSEFVAYPFTSSVAATKSCSLATPQKKKVILASRSVKTLAKDSHLPSIFDSDRDRDVNAVKYQSSLLSCARATMTPQDFHGSLHNEHSHDESSSDDDEEQHDHEPQYYHLPQQLEPHERHGDGAADSDGELPIHYRYFGKSRPRLRNHDSIPFIFLGPSVDHWKMVGQNLASRGFSVMAASLDEDGTDGASRLPDEDKQPQLVEAILEALRWNRAILVGCDSAAIVAIRAALRLAPEGRIAGLILCGDLSEAQRHTAGPVDLFLRQHMTACPFSVIWDGDQSTLPMSEDANGGGAAAVALENNHRCLIRGGGSAPHRRLPEQFAWALTRFVEEQVAPIRRVISEAAPSVSRRLQFLNRVNFTPGGFLVAGRVLAEAVFYLSAMKVVMYQYENIYDGILRINRGYKELSIWPRRILKLVGNIVLGWSGLKVKGTRRTSEPSFEEVIIMPHMQHEEEIEKEPTQEFLPLAPPATRDEIRWPIPLINPVAV